MNKIICWWSGGITSAVACKIAIDFYGTENCIAIMLDTKNEHEDTYRFKKDCEKWYGIEIESYSRVDGEEFSSIEDVWKKYKSLNVAHGAICSTVLKREMRESIQKEIEFSHQVFGFEFEKSEFNRALALSIQYPKSKPIFPLLMMGYDKKKCIQIVQDAGIEVPFAYKMGFQNNNCLKTGCVQGGIGYWQKMKREFPDKFEKMALMEHELTDLKGEPVTMLKDQSNEAKEKVDSSGNKWEALVFLKKHPKYPELKTIDQMSGREVEPLMECNGFCGVNILNPESKTVGQLNLAL